MKNEEILNTLAGEVQLGDGGNKYIIVMNNDLQRNNILCRFRKYLLHDLDELKSYSAYHQTIKISCKPTSIATEQTFVFLSATDKNPMNEIKECDRLFMDEVSSHMVLPWAIKADDQVILNDKC